MVSIATGVVVETAERLGSKAVAAKTFGKVASEKVQLVSL